MKTVAVATAQGGLDDVVSQVFSRCQTFTVVEVEGLDIINVKTEPNPSSSVMGHTGIQAAERVCDIGVNAVVAGNFGPQAASAR